MSILVDAGIVRVSSGHHLGWGGFDPRTGQGFGALRWAPRWFRRAVIVAWNRVACAVWGHNVLHLWDAEERMHYAPRCTACSRRWPCDGSCGRPA